MYALLLDNSSNLIMRDQINTQISPSIISACVNLINLLLFQLLHEKVVMEVTEDSKGVLKWTETCEGVRCD